MKSCDTGTATKWRYDAIDFLISERYSTFKARASFSILIKLLTVSRYDFIFIGDMIFGRKKVSSKIPFSVHVLQF